MESIALINSSSPFRFSIDLALLACLSIGGLYATARVALSPRDPAQGVAVVYAPWTPSDAAFVRTVAAGGRFVRFGGAAFVAVAMPDQADFSDRVLAAGAWLIVDPRILAACLSPFSASAADR